MMTYRCDNKFVDSLLGFNVRCMHCRYLHGIFKFVRYIVHGIYSIIIVDFKNNVPLKHHLFRIHKH